jgi:hypothetical protein
VEVTEPTQLVINVSQPTLTVYRPVPAKDTGIAILICPGGGYWDLLLEPLKALQGRANRMPDR